MTNNDGGPIFPRMTLRQYYASAALMGLLADASRVKVGASTEELSAAISDLSFTVADAMLAHEQAESVPVPPVVPVEPPVIPPPVVHQGRVIPLDKVEGMTEIPGGWASKPGWQTAPGQIVLLRYVTNATYGDTVTESYTIKGKIDFGVKDSAGKLIANLKIHRLWPASGGNYCNVFEGQSPGDPSVYLHAENMTAIIPAGKTVFAANHRQFNYGLILKMFDGNFHDIIRTFTYPSGLGKADGKYKVTVDNEVALEISNWQVNDTKYPAIPNIVNIQLDISSHKQSADAFVQFTKVLVTVR